MANLQFTKMSFGEGAIKALEPEIKKHKWQKALLVTGQGSIKRNSVYEDIKHELDLLNVELIEFWNIKPNPTHVQINDAAKLGKEAGVDFVIAAGGGSAIDASKVIATMIANPEIADCWDIVTKKALWKNEPLDIISIITLAGTASEVNAGSVVTNETVGLKTGVFTKAPILAICDPTYTFNVDAWQTASGIFDCFSHLTEQWFSREGSFEWTDNYNIALLKTLLSNAPKVLHNLRDYQARANILFTTSMALNGLSSFNMPGSDWGVHGMAHVFAAKYDTTHGATLALITPTYWRHFAEQNPLFRGRLVKLGKELFATDNVDQIINEVRKFIISLKLPLHYTDFDESKDFTMEDIDKLVVRDYAHLKATEMLTIFKKITV